ncbi:MAG: hypothetical protein R3B82_05900 [Sandaracinaceae bacterium]
MRPALVVITALLCASCDCSLGPRVTLVVNLLTDIQPGFEFDAIHTDVDGVTGDYEVRLGDRFDQPAPVAELAVPPGVRHLRVRLLDQGSFVAEGQLITEIRTAASRIVRIQAACRRVSCEAGLVCLDGVCIRGGEVTCPGEEEVCPRECVTDAECPPPGDGCSDAACVAGACLGVPREAACPDGYRCSVGVGCVLGGGDSTDGGVLDGSVLDGSALDGSAVDPDAGQPELCTTCVTECGTPGEEVCVGGVGTGVCIATEVLNLADDDCDGLVDEGFGPGEHTHAVVCYLGDQLVDSVEGQAGGGICSGGACGTTLTRCRTLRNASDAHWHDLSPSSIAIPGDSWFSCPGGTATVNGHSHGVRCNLSAPTLTADTFFHEIDPSALPGRYNKFCIPPGRQDGQCRTTWGPMTAY